MTEVPGGDKHLLVKVKSFRAPRLLIATAAQGRVVLRGFGWLVRDRMLFALAAIVTAVILFALIYPHDQELLRQVSFSHGEGESWVRGLAYFLGTWGDYPTYNVPLALAIWLYGVWRKSGAWRRVAVVCFLGATLAGLFDDCFRLTLGRPRPDAHVPDGFYGIAATLQGKFQSFPSGHAAAVFGAAAALLVAKRSLGLAATAFAFAVIWARMELYRHYPSDVVVGSVIGIYFGLMVGYGAKLRRPRSSRQDCHPCLSKDQPS